MVRIEEQACQAPWMVWDSHCCQRASASASISPDAAANRWWNITTMPEPWWNV